MRDLSVRAQLTVWYLLVTFAGLSLFGFLSYGALHFALFQGKKSHLQHGHTARKSSTVILTIFQQRLQEAIMPCEYERTGIRCDPAL